MEKTYDRLEWSFIKKRLLDLGFCDDCISGLWNV